MNMSLFHGSADFGGFCPCHPWIDDSFPWVTVFLLECFYINFFIKTDLAAFVKTYNIIRNKENTLVVMYLTFQVI